MSPVAFNLRAERAVNVVPPVKLMSLFVPAVCTTKSSSLVPVAANWLTLSNVTLPFVVARLMVWPAPAAASVSWLVLMSEGNRT